MKTRIVPLILAAPLALIVSQAQQSPSPQPAATQTAPCINTSVPTNPGNSTTFKTPSKWKQILDKQRQQLQAATGISVPDPTRQVEQTVNAKPNPCPTPPNAPAAKPAPPIPAATPKVSSDTTSLRCNPLVLGPDAGGSPLYVLPNPQNYAVPRPNTVLADTVVPDPTALTSCQRVRFDQKTSKAFLK